MIDRQPTKPGRIKLTADPNAEGYYYMERADEPTAEGTPVNKATLFNDANNARYGCSLPSEAFGLLTKEWLVDLPADAWSTSVDAEGFIVQTVVVADMKETYAPQFMPSYDSAATIDEIDDAFAVIKRMVTMNGSVKFLATEAPKTDITIRVVGV